MSDCPVAWLPPLLRGAIPVALLGLLVTLLLMLFGGSDPAGSIREGVPRGSDFLSFWGGSTMLIEDRGDQLYDHPELWKRELAATPSRIRFHNLYPPPVYQAMEPLARLPYPTGARLHLVLMLALLLGATRGLMAVSPPLPGDRRLWLGALAVLPVVFMNTTTGQLAGVWLLLLVGGVALMRSGRPGWGGAVLGLLCMKPSIGAAVAGALLLTGQVSALLGFGLAGASLLGASIALDGTAPWLAWFEMMTGDNPRSFFSVPHRQLTLRGLLAGPFRDTDLAPPLSLLAMALGAGMALLSAPAAWGVERSDPRWTLRFGLVLSALLLALPHLVEYDQGLHALGVLGSVPLLASAQRPRLGLALLAFVFLSPVLHEVGRALHVALAALALLGWWWWAWSEDRGQPAFVAPVLSNGALEAGSPAGS